MTPRLVLVLSENWTLTPPRDLRALVEMAVVAEEAGFDAVMVSEHVVLGPSAGANGVMGNPRDYAMPGNQDPAMPWPSSLVLLSAIAAATTRLRLAACAMIAPLRHPLLLARELGTLDILSEGRLVVQPTVSWHRDEYEALGVPFEKRGALLDEHLAAWEGSGATRRPPSRASTTPTRTCTSSPRRWRLDGPRLWLGGESVHPRLLRRIVRYAHGFHPLGQPSEEDMRLLRDGLAAAGRDLVRARARRRHARRLPGRREPVSARARDRVDPGHGRARLRHVLHQAVAVRRRHRALPGLVPRGGRAGCRHSSALVAQSHKRPAAGRTGR